MSSEPFSLQQLYEIICSRRDSLPTGSYTATLFTQGEAKIAQKVGEEATEVIVAALAQSRERLIEESADLTYHWLVLLAAKGISLADVMAEFVNTKSGRNRYRCEVGIKQKFFDPIRELPLIETQSGHFLRVLQAGTVSINNYLRRLHNFALG